MDYYQLSVVIEKHSGINKYWILLTLWQNVEADHNLSMQYGSLNRSFAVRNFARENYVNIKCSIIREVRQLLLYINLVGYLY